MPRERSRCCQFFKGQSISIDSCLRQIQLEYDRHLRVRLTPSWSAALFPPMNDQTPCSSTYCKVPWRIAYKRSAARERTSARIMRVVFAARVLAGTRFGRVLVHSGLPLFLSPAGGFIAERSINRVFQKHRTNPRWTARGGRGNVRIHDLRHNSDCRNSE